MSGLWDDPAVDDRLAVGYDDSHPLDYVEMREGPPPKTLVDRAKAVPTVAAGELAAAVKLLSSRDLKLKIAVVDAYTGQELWLSQLNEIYRFGERVTVTFDLSFGVV